MKILVTTGSWCAPLAVMESLAKQGHEVCLLDQDPLCAGFRSRYCSEGILCPKESDSGTYVQALEHLLKSRAFDLVIPSSDLSTEALSAHRERILPHAGMLLPSHELVKLARHKDRTYHFALANGIPIPKTQFPQSLSDVAAISRGLVFPCVVKKSRGTANKGNTYINNAGALQAYYQDVDLSDGWPVIQEFITGDIYGFLGVASEGRVLDCVMYKSRQEYSLAGTAAYYHSVIDPDFLALAKRIVERLGWSGAINMDMVRDKDGRLYLLEINPRLSGTLKFACCLGVDLPAVYLALANGEKIKEFEGPRYPDGVAFRFVLPAEILFAFGHKEHRWPLFANFFNFKMKTDIPWHDPQLLFWKLKHVRWCLQDMKNSSKIPSCAVSLKSSMNAFLPV